mmetsp:Transcript_28060/g.61562  ORF Transcript_28060/g.61562 Transcript_28060/m.61562 type:complete len:154 (-) Transcript_28060:56-517(-)
MATSMKRLLVMNNWSYDGSGVEDGDRNATSPSFDNAEKNLDESVTSKRCFSLGECERCGEHVTKVKASTIEGCNKTGRRERYECVVLKEEKEIRRFELYQPCQRTVADEEFLMVQMQLLCVIFGLFSVLLMQKQKHASISLFDQRREKSRDIV